MLSYASFGFKSIAIFYIKIYQLKNVKNVVIDVAEVQTEHMVRVVSPTKVQKSTRFQVLYCMFLLVCKNCFERNTHGTLIIFLHDGTYWKMHV